MTRSLPIGATGASRLRHDLARELAQACPSILGQEIALTGSALLGVADGASDVELSLLVDELLSVEARAAWIESIGGIARDVKRHPGEEIGTLDATYCFRDVWIEAG